MNNTLEKRYENDPAFHMAVKHIYQIMSDSNSQLTPIDVRDACYLARVHFEMYRVPPIVMSENMSDFIESTRVRREREHLEKCANSLTSTN